MSASADFTRNNEYDPFARIYNRHWGADYRAEAFPIVERLLLSRLRKGAAVLDLCCGTGQFTRDVRQRGFDVWGLDASAEMIRYARENAPGANLTVADARLFSLGRKFDAAYSVFESLNHVPDISGLTSAFESVRKHLKRGGSFLFDLNREEAFQLFWNTTDAVVADDEVCVLRMTYDEDTRAATCLITAMEKDDGWTRSDFTIRQTYHDPDEVMDALYETGFTDVAVYDARDAGMNGDAGQARIFFLATA
jgi:SAM-dependent methyltransferase